MTTWGEVHTGDTVRGADQRAWTVTGIRRGATWQGDGRTDLHLTLRLDGREVRARRPAHAPTVVVSRAGHRDLAGAWAALAPHFTLTVMEETLSTASTDPFTAPATGGDGVKRDRYGRYLLPDPGTGVETTWTRATTVARTLADEYHLTRWKMRQVARGLALRPDLVAGAAAADPEADKGTLDNIAERAMERAGSSTGATLGTALHSFAQRLDGGESIDSLGAPVSLDGDLREYVATLARHRLKVRREYIERIAVLPDLGVAGTLDRIVSQPAGVTKSRPLAVLDLKTAKSVDYSMLEIGIQLALYAHAPLLWDPARQAYEPMPAEVDTDRALVLHLPAGRAHGQVYGVNITEGWEYAHLALQVRRARNRGKGLGWLVDPEPADLALHHVTRAADRAELARLWDQLHPRGLWTEEVSAAATYRLTELTETQPASA